MTFSVLLCVRILAAVHEWKSFRHAADVAETYGVPAFHFFALSKKAGQVPYGMIKEVFSLALSRCNRHFRRASGFPKELLLVDSTTMTVGKSRLPWAPYPGSWPGTLPAALAPRKTARNIGVDHQ
ncbi:hypothetical protein [Aneurinibacillus aneurinilyticus]|uniref:hypothetical protein n=1 Tax=Aneurinibacillus aneurinilyticus TaxID=1391 RepID=UPI00352386FD